MSSAEIGNAVKSHKEAGIEWNIPKFFSFAENINSVESSIFFFMGTTWRLDLSLKSEILPGYMGLCLKKIKNSNCSVNYNLGLIKLDKTVELIGGGILGENCVCSDVHYIKLSYIQERKDELTSSDAFNIKCTLIHGIIPPFNLRKFQVAELQELTNIGFLRDMYKHVLMDGQNHDVILKVRDVEFPAHRDILRAHSRVFQSLLDQNIEEKDSGVIEVPDCDPKAMEQFLLYVYCQKIERLDERNMFGLYHLANIYNMPELKGESRDFILKSMSPTNICEIIQFAWNHGDSSLQERATEHFCNNVNNILNTDGWKTFMIDNSILVNDLIKKAFSKLRNPKGIEEIVIE